MAAAVVRVVEELGAPSALVNAAGIYPPTTLETATVELYRRTFDVNVLGTILVTQATAPHMREGAAIVNFASIDAFVPSPGQLVYCASKAAVVALTRSLALELAPRVRVNAIAPGWVDTPGNRATGRMEAALAGVPLGRAATPEEMADLVWFLAGEGRAGIRHRRDDRRHRRQRFPVNGRLAGRVAIVTGGARGQGLSHAERLAREGATVITGDVLDEPGEEAAAGLRAEGLDVTYRHLDVTSPADWTAAAADATARGPLRVLVNNAGVIHVTPLLDETLEAWNRLLAVNTTGALLGMQAAIPAMKAAGGGSIINVASIFGVNASEGYAAYTASKAAIIALTKTAALEHAADRIRVNAICPGGVSTPMNENEPEGGVVPLTPLGRRAQPGEISGAVAYLASDDASFVTGTELVIDGGYLAR